MSQLQKIEYFCLVKEIMWEKIISYDGNMHFFLSGFAMEAQLSEFKHFMWWLK
jgi:hypothetical protein